MLLDTCWLLLWGLGLSCDGYVDSVTKKERWRGVDSMVVVCWCRADWLIKVGWLVVGDCCLWVAMWLWAVVVITASTSLFGGLLYENNKHHDSNIRISLLIHGKYHWTWPSIVGPVEISYYFLLESFFFIRCDVQISLCIPRLISWVLKLIIM